RAGPRATPSRTRRPSSSCAQDSACRSSSARRRLEPMPAPSALERDLGSFLPRESIVVEGRTAYLADETEGRGILGRAEAVVVPSSTEEVCKVLAWCYDKGVPVVPRGGGTGFAGGAVPLVGGIVLGLARLARIRSFDPLLWRICVEAGLRTADLRRMAREHGPLVRPDPGAAE